MFKEMSELSPRDTVLEGNDDVDDLPAKYSLMV